MVLGYLKAAFKKPDHPTWVISQQVVVRGLLALKFLLAARFLGPEQIGLVGVALLSLAIVESLSDTGLSQAIIQRRKVINSAEAGAVWTLLLCRGLALSALLLLAAIPISRFFEIEGAAPLVALAAIIPLLRNAINPGYFLVQRACNFRGVSIYEGSSALIDFGATMLLIQLNFGAASLLLGNIASDSVKVLSSWFWFKMPLKPNFRWRILQSLTAFGKWIWGTSFITLILNQLDKVLVAKFLGPVEFGLYQVATRVAQLVVSDAAVALGQYLYPIFSDRNRSSSDTAKLLFESVMKKLVVCAFLISILLIILAPILLGEILGDKWIAATPVLRVMTISMFLGALIALLIAYIRAMGKPKTVTVATSLQLFALIIFAPPLIMSMGSVGMAAANAIGLLIAVVVFMMAVRKMK